MAQTKYIQTDSNTVNLVELVLLEIKELKAKVCTINLNREPEQFYNEEKAAKFLGISKKQMYNLRISNQIHYRMIGTSVRYSLVDIEEFQEGCRR